jgi:hypothetical protein
MILTNDGAMVVLAVLGLAFGVLVIQSTVEWLGLTRKGSR